MRRVRVRWLLFPSYLLIALLTLVISTASTFVLVKQFHYNQTEQQLEARSQIVLTAIEDLDIVADREQIASICERMGSRSGTRITIIGTDGAVFADSDRNPSSMDSHADREEVREALTGTKATASRFSHTLQKEMLYFAIPLESGGRLRGIVRTALPLRDVEQALGPVRLQTLIGVLSAALFASIVSFWVSRRFAKPMEEMRVAAENLSAGGLHQRLGDLPSEEGHRLARAINNMASQLEKRIAQLGQRNQEVEALVGSMLEGVLAVDADSNVLRVNRAALALFHALPADGPDRQLEGRSIQEVVRNTHLLDIVRRTLASEHAIEAELIVSNGSEQVLQVHGTPLRRADGTRFGAVIVLNNITRQRNMENERRELVASVTHELRTPITAIKGFLETLQSGALEDPEDARRFVDIAMRQTDRLHSMIEDLLHLARIERETDRKEVELTLQPIGPILAVAIDTCRGVPGGLDAEIRVESPPEIEAFVNAGLLEQALVNLVTNAIHYGAPPIDLTVSDRGDAIDISVRDHGAGVAREHADRVFERFYTADKARSRELGGTGLGLAIVKHIARAHHGEVGVRSEPGEGAEFLIRLPKGSTAEPA